MYQQQLGRRIKMWGFIMTVIDDIIWLFSHIYCKLFGHKFNMHYMSLSKRIDYCSRCGEKAKWNVVQTPDTLDDVKTIPSTSNPLCLDDTPLGLKRTEVLTVWYTKYNEVLLLVDGVLYRKLHVGDYHRVFVDTKKRTGHVVQDRKRKRRR
jgi:hypothetical protein